MSNLDQAVAEWRGRVIAAGISQPFVLDELENHLREHVEQLTREGKTEQEAFDAAVQRIGQLDMLKREFAKAEGFLGLFRHCTSTRTHRVLAVVWMARFCWLLAWILFLIRLTPQHIPPSVIAFVALISLFAVCGIVASVYLFKGSSWGRRTVRILALVSAAVSMTQIYVDIPLWLSGRLLLERQMLVWGAVAMFSLITVWLLHSPRRRNSHQKEAAG